VIKFCTLAALLPGTLPVVLTELKALGAPESFWTQR